MSRKSCKWVITQVVLTARQSRKVFAFKGFDERQSCAGRLLPNYLMASSPFDLTSLRILSRALPPWQTLSRKTVRSQPVTDRGLATKLETALPERKTDVIKGFGDKREEVERRLLLCYYEIAITLAVFGSSKIGRTPHFVRTPPSVQCPCLVTPTIGETQAAYLDTVATR